MAAIPPSFPATVPLLVIFKNLRRLMCAISWFLPCDPGFPWAALLLELKLSSGAKSLPGGGVHQTIDILPHRMNVVVHYSKLGCSTSGMGHGQTEKDPTGRTSFASGQPSTTDHSRTPALRARFRVHLEH